MSSMELLTKNTLTTAGVMVLQLVLASLVLLSLQLLSLHRLLLAATLSGGLIYAGDRQAKGLSINPFVQQRYMMTLLLLLPQKLLPDLYSPLLGGFFTVVIHHLLIMKVVPFRLTTNCSAWTNGVECNLLSYPEVRSVIHSPLTAIPTSPYWQDGCNIHRY